MQGYSGLINLQHRTYYKIVCRGNISIAEVGFNAAHSAMLMLIANPLASVQSFDIGHHSCARDAFQYIRERFPGRRLDIEWGDSTETVPAFHARCPDRTFDAVIVHGLTAAATLTAATG